MKTQEEINREIVKRCEAEGIMVMQMGNRFGTHAGDSFRLNQIIAQVRGY